jgi:predicted transcriptional regulator
MTRQQFVAMLRELGLSQSAFARLVGLTPSAVLHWASNASATPIPKWVPLLLAAWQDNKRLREAQHSIG